MMNDSVVQVSSSWNQVYNGKTDFKFEIPEEEPRIEPNRILKPQPRKTEEKREKLFETRFFLTEAEKQSNIQFKRTETIEQVETNWKNYRQEMTRGYKEKLKDAQRSLNKLKNLKRPFNEI